ncbi:hypothetical protein GCM10023168_21120 [Fodinibacter luteus]|uniref:PASTA domain-containing protein n=1 Tax=Fodinibacter luteus TaxID=552064 RepID=A0ABP8KFZ5_9MICO
MATGEATPPVADPGSTTEVHGQVSDVSGGQVAVGGRVFQIDAAQGSYVVINADSDVEVVRRPPPVLRPPPAFPGLVARTAELRRVRTALAAGRSVEVHGPGGIGKTALLRAASNAPLPETTPDGVIAIPARLGTADTLAYVYDTCYVGSRRVVPRREELTSALCDLRLLVVLDDTSLGRDDIDALREELPSSLLLLAGTEQRVFDGVEGVALAGLTTDEGVELIAAAVGRELSERERDVGTRVSEVLHGTPLELVRFASLVRADDGDLVSVARGFGVDAQPEDLLVAVLRSVSVQEDAVLAALAAFDAPVGAGPVAAFSGHADAGSTLHELSRRGIVQGDDLQGWRARDHMAASPEERRRAAVVLTAWVRERAVPEEVAGEIPTIASALRQADRDRRWEDAVALAAAAQQPLALAGRWSAWRDTLEAGRSAADALGDTASRRFFDHELAVVDDAMTTVIPVVDRSTRTPPAPPPEPPSPPLPEPVPPEPLPPEPVPIRWGRVLGAAAALLVVIGLVVGAVVAFASRGGSDEETAAPTGTVAPTTTPPTTGTGTPTPTPVEGAPNLVAFTLDRESDELVVGEERAFTVRVQNRPLDSRDIGPSEGGTLTVGLSGEAADIVEGRPRCTTIPEGLSCDLEGVPVRKTADVKVTLRGVSEGSVVLESFVQATGSAGRPGDPRTIKVISGPCTVPNVVGMTVDAARSQVERAGFTAQLDPVEDGQASELVIDQSPPPDAELDCGGAVTLTFSTVT